MKHPRKGIVFLLSVLLSLCANGRVESRDKSSSTPTILISFDGAQPQVIEKLLKSGKLPANGGFAKLTSEGTQAQGMTAVLPTVTATNHITLATGAYPERTNIPANTFHLTDTPLTTTTSGFGTEIEAETLWEAAKRQGKKVITIAFAGADGRGDARRGDQTLGFGVVDGFSVIRSMNGSHFDSATGATWNLGSEVACEFKKGNLGTATANQVFFRATGLGQTYSSTCSSATPSSMDRNVTTRRSSTLTRIYRTDLSRACAWENGPRSHCR